MCFNQFSYQPTTSSQRFAELEGLGLKLSPQLSLKKDSLKTSLVGVFHLF